MSTTSSSKESIETDGFALDLIDIQTLVDMVELHGTYHVWVLEHCRTKHKNMKLAMHITPYDTEAAIVAFIKGSRGLKLSLKELRIDYRSSSCANLNLQPRRMRSIS